MFGLSKSCLFSFVVCAAIFILFPQIDIWIAGIFCDPITEFHQNHPPLVLFIYRSVEVLAVILVFSLITSLIITLIKKKDIFSISSKKIIYLLLLLALGPGLVVNIIFKDHWGRARPAQIREYGGQKEFTPAFVLSDQCPNNCSFVSGHASFGFYLVSIAFLMTRHRKKMFAFALCYGSIIGLVRMYQGRHFLSDVVFSFFFVYIVARILYYWMFERKPKDLPQKLEDTKEI